MPGLVSEMNVPRDRQAANRSNLAYALAKCLLVACCGILTGFNPHFRVVMDLSVIRVLDSSWENLQD